MAQHKIAYSRQLISWNDLTSDFGDCALVPMPYSVWVVARKLLAERGLWQSTFYVGSPAPGFTFYESPEYTDPDWLIWKDELTTFLFDSEEFMTKFDDLLAGQAGIEDAIRDLQELLRTSAGASFSGQGQIAAPNYPISYTGYIEPGATSGEISEGKCNAGEWIWEAFSEICTEVDDVMSNIQDLPFGGALLAIAEALGGLLDILPDNIVGVITRAQPGFLIIPILDNLDDNENATKTALINAYSEQDIREAFNWIDTTGDTILQSFVDIVIHSLAIIGLDMSRWANIPQLGQCQPLTELGDWTAVLNYYQLADPPEDGYIGPISEDNFYQEFESMPFSVWGLISDGPPAPPNNGYEYFTAINLDGNSLSDTRTFEITGVTGYSEALTFYSNNNFTGQISNHNLPGLYTVTGCNSLRFRTTRYSGERASVIIRGGS